MWLDYHEQSKTIRGREGSSFYKLYDSELRIMIWPNSERALTISWCVCTGTCSSSFRGRVWGTSREYAFPRAAYRPYIPWPGLWGCLHRTYPSCRPSFQGCDSERKALSRKLVWERFLFDAIEMHWKNGKAERCLPNYYCVQQSELLFEILVKAWLFNAALYNAALRKAHKIIISPYCIMLICKMSRELRGRNLQKKKA